MLFPVIICGGRGTRLWPLSRNLYAKQVIPLTSGKSLLQATVDRVTSWSHDRLIVICNESSRFIIAEQLETLSPESVEIIVEPLSRSTAPCVAVAALLAYQQDAESVVAILPSDHQIGKPDILGDTLNQAESLAREGYIVTLGIPPTGPKTGYGYMEKGEKITKKYDGYRIKRFIEKPGEDTAQSLLSTAQNAYWNAGIFVARASTIIEEMKQYRPDILDACQTAIEKGKKDLHFLRLEQDAYEGIEATSFDVAVMEQTQKAAMIPVEMEWNDLGSWDCLWQVGEKDEDGNVIIGDVFLNDVKNSYIRSQGRLVAGLGLDGVAVVETEDAILITARNQAQDVRQLVETIRTRGRGETENHVQVDRPWGFYKILDEGPAYKCKLIHVKPKKRLSLQKHAHRSEHWVVVRGTARVERDGQVRLLHPNQSTYLPAGCRHRLENPSETPLSLIEVQTGTYLGEDDIVRLEDDFGRP